LRLTALWFYGSAILTLGLLVAFAGAIDQPGCGPADDCEHGYSVGWALFSAVGSVTLAPGARDLPSGPNAGQDSAATLIKGW